MSRLRFQPTEWGTHFITQRNLMGYSLMRPTPRTNAIIAGCLGYSLKRFKGVIELHAHVFLSNHYHMILSAYSQRDLSAFMSHFNGCLNKRVRSWSSYVTKITVKDGARPQVAYELNSTQPNLNKLS